MSKETKPDGQGPPRHDVPDRVENVDWSAWRADDVATLTFVRRSNEVLLIRKKRGLGAGKVNAPGGRVEGEESIEECAVREVEEELHVTPARLDRRGELRFQFLDGYALHVHVIFASDHDGTAQETDEAAPMWTPVDAVPYDEMWADDRFWLPHALAGHHVDGRFIFDHHDMLDMDLRVRMRGLEGQSG
ncbi:MAG: 8-oxo-dGTP diphosphatase [Thermoanaerobaculia bacterium]|nr:8-oxo-dGTP diphosphatase [Thermoanaerobaculia bacterium]